MQDDLISDHDVPAVSHDGAYYDAAVLEFEFSAQEFFIQSEMFDQGLFVGSEHQRLGVEPPRSVLYQHRRLHDGSGICSAGFEFIHHKTAVADDSEGTLYLKMRLGLHQFLLHKVGKSGHYRQHDHKDSNSESDAENTGQSDERYHIAARFEKLPRQK